MYVCIYVSIYYKFKPFRIYVEAIFLQNVIHYMQVYLLVCVAYVMREVNCTKKSVKV